jgi:hypothetical protein
LSVRIAGLARSREERFLCTVFDGSRAGWESNMDTAQSRVNRW